MLLLKLTKQIGTEITEISIVWDNVVAGFELIKSKTSLRFFLFWDSGVCSDMAGPS